MFDTNECEFNGLGFVRKKRFLCAICGEAFSEKQLIDKKTPSHNKKNSDEACVYKGQIIKDDKP